jgi:capsular polysaccharide biosynthesis protein
MQEAVYGEEFCHNDPSYNYFSLPCAVTLSGNWTSLISLWSEGFYHWFTDALPRLALLDEMPADTGILVRGPLRPYQQESLRMLGLLDRVRETSGRHLLIEDYYFSSPVGMTGCTNPYAVKWLRDQFLQHAASIETPKQFFIRRKGKTRGILNQDEVAEFFIALGWSVVDLEELNFAEQIAWFHNAAVIVGEHGGAFTNLLWCRPGCRVLELCPDNFLNGCYEGISLCLALKHEFQIYHADNSNRFCVSLRNLKHSFNEF